MKKEQFDEWRKTNSVSQEFFKLLTEGVKRIENMPFLEVCNLAPESRSELSGYLKALTEMYNVTYESFIREGKNEDNKTTE